MMLWWSNEPVASLPPHVDDAAVEGAADRRRSASLFNESVVLRLGPSQHEESARCGLDISSPSGAKNAAAGKQIAADDAAVAPTGVWWRGT